MPRVAAVALDSLEWWYLERLVANGRMPNLARILDRSAHFPLETPLAYRTELVWARFLSGQEPLETKDWAASVQFDTATYGLARTPASPARPFYSLSSQAKVVAMDLIHTRLDDQVDGVQVTAWGSHSPHWLRMSKPAGLITEIDRRFGVNPAFNNEFGPGWWDHDFIDALADASAVGAQRRFDACRWLLEQNPDWDLFLTCVSEFHTTGHQMWHGVDERHSLHATPYGEHSGRRADECAAAIDVGLGELLDALPDDTTLLVFSLHGLEPADDVFSTATMGELFHRLLVDPKGLLRSPDHDTWVREGRPPMAPAPGEHLGEYFTDRFADSPKQRVRRMVREAIGRDALNGLRRLAGKKPMVPMSAMANPTEPESFEVRPEDLEKFTSAMKYQVVSWYARHWPTMPYFTLPTFGDGHVRVNLQGREAHGIVPREDYRKAMDEAVGHLRACVDDRTGKSVVGDVIYLREDDPYDPDGPDADFLVYIDGGPDCIVHPETGPIGPFPHVRTSQHSGNGFALVSGPGIAPGRRETRPSIDLTPTVLALLGVQDAVGCKGQSLLHPVP